MPLFRTIYVTALVTFALSSSSACDGCSADPCSAPDACARDARCAEACAPTPSGSLPVLPDNDDAGAGGEAGDASEDPDGSDGLDDDSGAGQSPPGEGEGEGDPGGEEGPPAAEGEGEGEDSFSPCGDHDPAPERCSFVDENCDGENNEALDCTFLATSALALWRVDPFKGTVAHVVDVDPPAAEILFDIDLDTDGSMLVTAGRTLYRLTDAGVLGAVEAGALPFNPNGLAVAADGSVFVTNHDALVGSRVVRAESSAGAPAFFSALSPWHSSGDCVHHKEELLITANGEDGDQLLSMSTATGELTLIGDLGVAGVMGMSSAFGVLFGVTSEGEILRIDSETGVSEIQHTTGVAFTGAASVH